MLATAAVWNRFEEGLVDQDFFSLSFCCDCDEEFVVGDEMIVLFYLCNETTRGRNFSDFPIIRIALPSLI